MKNELILIIAIFTLYINIISCERCEKYTESLFFKTIGGPFTNTGLTCGKEKPKSQTDCTKYGTDSKMYCCWVAKNENDLNGKCHLISLAKIERTGIDGCAQFSDSYWSCGNFSNYIKTNKMIILLMIISLFIV